MLRLSKSIPLTCRNVPLVHSRSRVTTVSKPSPNKFTNKGPKQGSSKSKKWVQRPGTMKLGLRSKPSGKTVTVPGAQIQTKLTPETLSTYLATVGNAWRQLPHLHDRFRKFGLHSPHLKPALTAFITSLQQPDTLSTIGFGESHAERVISDLQDSSHADALDIWLTRLFYEWASHPSSYSVLRNNVPDEVISNIRELFRAADMSAPATYYPITRTFPRRKVIMHVGPTNSGKTHNALRALAAARTGCYAGPLRLLAHEIFERLNKGQIMPLGAEIEEASEPEPDTESNLDVSLSEGKVVVRKDGNPKWARACNLVTGEEQKVVDPAAGLTSCTVEMLNLILKYDVAVVDEIQLLAEKERGGSWSSAVLGLNARELHLCGEEAAVPLVERMLRDTGDELIVNRYERLTPLKVAEQSLQGDISKIQKGDCIVTFSRSGIFALKKQVEKATGLKCAVAYGRLPPEIRSEQAALFNDPTSGYDVLVGSDAIGMGLNLKVKRIVFEMVSKFDGREERPLSVPQIKQIAGRAGRFGLHSKDSVGVCTTLKEEDLPILRDALLVPPEPLRVAVLNSAIERLLGVLQNLPPDSTLSTAFLACKYIGRVHPAYEYQDITTTMTAVEYMDKITSKLTIEDKFLFQKVPVPWRDGIVVKYMTHLLNLFAAELRVDLRKLLKKSGLGNVLQEAQLTIKNEDRAKVLKPKGDALVTLESLHKCLIGYIWLAYRNPVSFPDQAYAVETKIEAEKAMEWYLNVISEKMTSKKGKVRETRPKH